MTESELLELISMNTDRLTVVSTNIATIFFAYVVCAYFAGNKLNQLYAILTSILYSGFVLGGILVMGITVDATYHYLEAYLIMFPDGIAVDLNRPPRWLAYLFALSPYILAWVVSLFFMHSYMRKRK